MCAPVNAPFSWPNNSLSSRFSGIALQLMATNGPSLRALRRWMAAAAISLPVPLSPNESTGACRGHFADECKGRLHLRTRAEHLLEDFRSLSLLQLSIFLFQFYNVDASAKQQL